jgi:hypothetical protein
LTNQVISKPRLISKNSTVKNRQHIRKWAKDMNRQVTEEDVQMAHKHVKRCDDRHCPLDSYKYNYNRGSLHVYQNG